MGYVEELRTLVGHRPLIMPGAAVLALDGRGCILLQRRTDNGLWGVPGGMMEPGESVEDTARRELLEETGLTVDRLVFYGIFSGPGYFHRYPNGDEVHNVAAVFWAAIGDAEPHGDGREVSETQFFPMAALPGDLSPPSDTYVRRFAAERTAPG